MPKIHLNNEECKIAEDTSVAELLQLKNIEAKNSVVAVNEQIIKLPEYPDCKLKDNDIVELMCFVGGG